MEIIEKLKEQDSQLESRDIILKNVCVCSYTPVGGNSERLNGITAEITITENGERYIFGVVIEDIVLERNGK